MNPRPGPPWTASKTSAGLIRLPRESILSKVSRECFRQPVPGLRLERAFDPARDVLDEPRDVLDELGIDRCVGILSQPFGHPPEVEEIGKRNHRGPFVSVGQNGLLRSERVADGESPIRHSLWVDGVD